jgi:predicted dehydrogenase
MSRREQSRREFMASSAGAIVAANAVALGDARVEAATTPSAVAPSDRVRFGIVGVGMQGSGLLASAIRLAGVECVAACDLYDGRHALAKEIVGGSLRTTRRYQELLADPGIDCLIAAVPDHWHKRLVVEAVRAGKDVYVEKPMSHSAADGIEMVAAARETGRIVQVGSQRVSSVVCAKAKELIAGGTIGELTLVEGSLGRNDPNGAWQYPPPPDLSPETLDWDTWQNDVPRRPFDANVFARWRCWKAYGTGVAGDLLVHLVSGMMHMLGWNEPPRRAMAVGGILRFPDGRDMPDVHATLFDYGRAPVYLRLNLGCETPETYRFQGSKGVLEVTETGISYSPQTGKDSAPSYYASSFPRELRESYFRKWHEEHDPAPGREPALEGFSYRSVSWDELAPHLWTFFDAVRSRKPVTEDAVFGHHAALACHMANEAYFRKALVTWNPTTGRIES